jgi:hypothetical protein
MDELINMHANSAAAYASAAQELRLLSQTRHTRSAYLAAVKTIEKALQESELAWLAVLPLPRQAR